MITQQGVEIVSPSTRKLHTHTKYKTSIMLFIGNQHPRRKITKPNPENMSVEYNPRTSEYTKITNAEHKFKVTK
jgi:hypothetical protein